MTYGEMQLDPAVAILFPPQADQHLALIRELDGIAHEIGNHLAEPDRVAAKKSRYIRVDLPGQLNPLRMSSQAKRLEGVSDFLTHVEIDHFEGQFAAGFPSQGVIVDEENTTLIPSRLPITIDVFDRDNVNKGHTYKLKFNVNDEYWLPHQPDARRSPYEAKFINDEIMVYDVTLGDSLVYHETHKDLAGSNFDSSDTQNYWAVTAERDVVTELFEGLRLQFRMPTVLPKPSPEHSGWLVGKSPVSFHNAVGNYQYFPWQYEFIWTDNPEEYTTLINEKDFNKHIEDRFGNTIDKDNLLLGQSFNFYVINKQFTDSLGNYVKLDIVANDLNGNGQYDPEYDHVLVGHAKEHARFKGIYVWSGTIFQVEFSNAVSTDNMPQPNDVYRIEFNRVFYHSDSLMFTITGLDDALDEARLKEDMENIKVVPNPYVVTNTMEGAVANWDRNQRRQIMFTHIPAQSKIRIFTVSGILVDEFGVDNSVAGRTSQWDNNSGANGTAHWDLRSKEGLEIAAGYYIYHIESKVTGDVKIGKFAVIK